MLCSLRGGPGELPERCYTDVGNVRFAGESYLSMEIQLLFSIDNIDVHVLLFVSFGSQEDSNFYAIFH